MFNEANLLKKPRDFRDGSTIRIANGILDAPRKNQGEQEFEEPVIEAFQKIFSIGDSEKRSGAGRMLQKTPY
ncbi:MAG: hypothetical protein P4L42_14935 [Desulfocapsaceae bacterium]|nr:hypothetical protein [Desulfocapsaceae bacterium]